MATKILLFKKRIKVLLGYEDTGIPVQCPWEYDCFSPLRWCTMATCNSAVESLWRCGWETEYNERWHMWVPFPAYHKERPIHNAFLVLTSVHFEIWLNYLRVLNMYIFYTGTVNLAYPPSWWGHGCRREFTAALLNHYNSYIIEIGRVWEGVTATFLSWIIPNSILNTYPHAHR